MDHATFIQTMQTPEMQMITHLIKILFLTWFLVRIVKTRKTTNN